MEESVWISNVKEVEPMILNTFTESPPYPSQTTEYYIEHCQFLLSLNDGIAIPKSQCQITNMDATDSMKK